MTIHLEQIITNAFEYCSTNSIDIPLDLHNRARRIGAVKVGSDFGVINAEYHDTITIAMTTYFEGGIITGPRNRFRQATTSAFYDMFYLGFADSGGGVPDTDAIAWLDARVSQEFGYIDALMEQIKLLKKEEDFDFFSWVTARADGYTATLAGIYNAAKMFAEKGKLLTWNLGNTEKHCDTCAQLNGQSHRASWYVSRNYIPRQPGASMLCGGYYCDCSLTDANGNEVTI
jgi:hypothetical protein